MVLIILVYLIDLIAYGATKDSNTWNCILYKSGAKYTYAISRKGHIHRLLLPMILHSGFFHIFWNLLALLMIGFAIEMAIAKWYLYLLLLLVGALGGVAFSAVIDPYHFGVGSSTSIFAILACMCLWFFLNHAALGPLKYRYLVFFGLMIFFAFINGFLFPGSGIDSWGHLGGFIFGLCMAFLIMKGTNDAQNKTLRRLRVPAIIGLVVLFLAFGIALFARPLPECGTVYNCKDVCSS